MKVSPALLLGLGAVVLAASSASGAAAPPRTAGGGSTHGRAEVPARQTGGRDAHAWTRSRYAAAVAALRALGLDDATARRVAIALVAQWARETGWGRAEWGFNVGNVKASNWAGDYHRLSDGSYYRSHATLEDGVRDAINLHRSSRYRDAFNYLVSSGDPVGWYDRIMRAGYHPWSQAALTEMGSIAARVGRDAVSGDAVSGDDGPWDVVGFCCAVAQQLGGL